MRIRRVGRGEDSVTGKDERSYISLKLAGLEFIGNRKESYRRERFKKMKIIVFFCL